MVDPLSYWPWYVLSSLVLVYLKEVAVADFLSFTEWAFTICLIANNPISPCLPSVAVLRGDLCHIGARSGCVWYSICLPGKVQGPDYQGTEHKTNYPI